MWRAAFAVVPVIIVDIVIALICANHVTKRFGKGIMPKQYRLREEDVKTGLGRLTGFAGNIARPTASRAPSGTMVRDDKEDLSGATAVISLSYKQK